MMNSVKRTKRPNEIRLQRALRENHDLKGDQVAILGLLTRLSELKSGLAPEFYEYLLEIEPTVVRVFDLDAEDVEILKKMVNFTSLGLNFIEEASPQDPYAFEQAEWLLRGSLSLSVIGTAMRLSLETVDGEGPQKIESEWIPQVSTAYRCMLGYAEVRLVHNVEEVICAVLEQKLTRYTPVEKLVIFLDELTRVSSDKVIHWIEPVQLKPGMKVLEDVFDENGLLLIAKNTKLSENLIGSLLSYDRMQGIEHQIPVETE